MVNASFIYKRRDKVSFKTWSSAHHQFVHWGPNDCCPDNLAIAAFTLAICAAASTFVNPTVHDVDVKDGEAE